MFEDAARHCRTLKETAALTAERDMKRAAEMIANAGVTATEYREVSEKVAALAT